MEGESTGFETFDGAGETAVFPGDLPDDPVALFHTGGPGFKGLTTASPSDADYRFLRFRPPSLPRAGTITPTLPHIRLDRALQFLLGDRLK
jgi:predicted YcjX-like family ATPase